MVHHGEAELAAGALQTEREEAAVGAVQDREGGGVDLEMIV